MLDVGWYRTTIRSFEREIYNIPNSVFSRNVVLNITRKNKEWRFYEFIGAPLQAGPAGRTVRCAQWLWCTTCRFVCRLASLGFYASRTRPKSAGQASDVD